MSDDSLLNWIDDEKLLELVCPPKCRPAFRRKVVEKFKFVVNALARDPSLTKTHFSTRCDIATVLLNYWVEKDYVVFGKGNCKSAFDQMSKRQVELSSSKKTSRE